MPYVPLHHKYRPQTFADLVGQEAIATTLSNAISRQQIAPAYLFTGPRGTGKTSSARIFAKSLNCLSSPTPTVAPCGECEVCSKISLGLALDIIEIDAASNTGVDNIREIIERAQFSPVQCRYKVYIIDEVHMLSTAAFNALLKTLEEPPSHVVFILATTDPQRVLPTITSRCQRYHFRRIPLEAMVRHLGEIASIEGIEITSGALTLVAQVAQGGLRDAESLLDQLSLLGEEVNEDKVWDLVGAVPERDLLQLLEAIAARSPESTLSQIRDLLDRGREPLVVLQQLAGFYRDLAIAKTAPSRGDLVTLTEIGWQKLVTLAQDWDLAAIIWGQEHLKSSELQLKQTTQPRLWLEVGVLGLLKPNIPASVPNPQNVAVSPAIAPVAKFASVQPTPVRHSTPPPPPAAVTIPTEKTLVATAITVSLPPRALENPENLPASASPELTASNTHPETEIVAPAEPDIDLESIWTQVIANLQPMATQALLDQHCYLLSFDGESAEIGVKSQPLLKHAQIKLPNIEAAFHKIYQQPVRIVLKVATSKSAAPNTIEPKSTGFSPAKEQKRVETPQIARINPNISTHVVQPPVNEPLPPVEIQLPAEEQDLVMASPVEVEDTQVINAAKSLANFFGGEVLQLGNDASPTSSGNLALESHLDSSLEAVSEDDEIDF